MTTATLDAAETLPRWDLDSIFPGPNSPEFQEASGSAGLAIAELTALFDRHGVGTRPMGAIDANAAAIFDEVVTHYDATLEAALRLDGYLGCLTAADVRNEAAQAAASEWREILVDLARLAQGSPPGSPHSTSMGSPGARTSLASTSRPYTGCGMPPRT